ncbi:thaumatin-like pathogenesis-related protein 1 [Hordeum vulgare]|nr:thaumatin-like pathogenesis-related protein 1 [Hordeum vulgare]
MVASSWALILLIAASFAAEPGATTFSITNRCSYPVWPATIPVGGGRRVNSGDTWNLEVPVGTSAARIWGRTGCNFNGDRGSCATGSEFSLGSQDYYNISVIDGYNVPMDFSCSTGVPLGCRDAGCYDAYHQPNDVRTKSCGGASRSFRVVFCP